MNTKLTASLLTLLFLLPTPLFAQKFEAPQVNGQLPALPQQLAAIVNDGRDPNALSNEELQIRLQTLSAGMGTPGMSPILIAILQRQIAITQSVLQSRQQAAPQRAPKPQPAPQVNPPPQTGVAPDQNFDPGKFFRLMQQREKIPSMADNELAAYRTQIAGLMQSAGTFPQFKGPLADADKEATAEQNRRREAATPVQPPRRPPPPEVRPQPTQEEVPPAFDGGKIRRLLRMADSISDMGDSDLLNYSRELGAQMQNRGLPPEIRGRLAGALNAANTELVGRQQASTPPPPPPRPRVEERPVVSAPVSPAPNIDEDSEREARNYLSDRPNLSRMSDSDFRERLNDIRELLAGNQISEDTERAVRTKLQKERDIFRLRKAQEEADRLNELTQYAPAPTVAPTPKTLPPPPPKPAGGINFNFSIDVVTPTTPMNQILGDRRKAEELRTDELQLRIQAYDEAIANPRYPRGLRDFWKKSLDYNREVLRWRMLEERRHRFEEIRARGRDDDLEAALSQRAGRRRHVNQSVFAAEVSAEELRDALTAPAPTGYSRQYRVSEIANDPDLRGLLPRVEVDTVHFGYNEGFVREEELSHLDALASLIERIVARRPNEIFLIEGNTDAPGSDEANLKLSKLRAESVKKLMVTYYNIDPKNLRTIGLGSRFLKIPTSEAEAENRRVSVTRITPLLALGQ